LTISYSGFENGDNPGSIVQPSASTTATTTSSVGVYPIVLNGGSATNYTITRVNGTLTIVKASVICKADDKAIYYGQSIPTRTATITSNTTYTVTGGPNFSFSPSCVGNTGVYTITPSCLVLADASSYDITYQTGKLYINPKGSGASKIVPALVCVDTLIGDPSGFKYLAKFKYTNSNSTQVYIASGTNNSLSSTGAFDGTAPQLFEVGTGYFNVKFTSGTITWTVKSYQSSTLTTVSASANSASPRCASGSARMIADDGKEESIDIDYMIYPNPVLDRVTITSPSAINAENVVIADLLGRTYSIGGNYSVSDQGITIDMSMFKNGIYFIRIQNGEEVKIFNIVKE
jgi:hypothetical protein